MTPAELLARCRALGIDLAAGPGGTLLWEADDEPPADLLADLAARKTELLALLRPSPPSPALWDATEAARPLAERPAEAVSLALKAPVIVTPDDLPADWRFAWEARAAIMEYDGKLPREWAASLALEDILGEMRRAGIFPRNDACM
jgi:sugar phosphate isomerase/epimerase